MLKFSEEHVTMEVKNSLVIGVSVMSYISVANRNQATLLPDSIEDYVGENSYVRLIDAFVDSLNMEELGFQRAVPASTGAPGFDPADMMKLYIYGYFNRIRTSRVMERECERNLELMWLINRLTPDFRSIAKFRHNNADAFKKVFREWNLFCNKLDLFGHEYISQDGSKFKAVNSKERNFTLTKLDDRIRRIDAHIEEYVATLDKRDDEECDTRKFTEEEIQSKVSKLKDRKRRYEGYVDAISSGAREQISLTDPESKLMKFGDAFDVGFNVQTAVDSKNHMISEFTVTDKCTDNGLLFDTANAVKETFGLKTIESTADKGFHDRSDMVKCLENGIVPNVIPSKKGEDYTLQTDFSPNEISEAEKSSTHSDDITKCLRAGVVPEIYAGIIDQINVKEIRVREYTDVDGSDAPADEAGMKAKAAEGYFVRDVETDKVYCPCGEVLWFCGKSAGRRSYRNKTACGRCMNKCGDAKYMDAKFPEGRRLQACRKYHGTNHAIRKKTVGTKMVVQFRFKPDARKMANRMCLSEHPFGTIKRWHNSSYLLLIGKKLVTGELAMSFLTYNIKRAINILGIPKLIAAI